MLKLGAGFSRCFDDKKLWPVLLSINFDVFFETVTILII